MKKMKYMTDTGYNVHDLMRTDGYAASDWSGSNLLKLAFGVVDLNTVFKILVARVHCVHLTFFHGSQQIIKAIVSHLLSRRS